MTPSFVIVGDTEPARRSHPPTFVPRNTEAEIVTGDGAPVEAVFVTRADGLRQRFNGGPSPLRLSTVPWAYTIDRIVP